jgi:transcriptional regulator with XRE-family HTH domain
MAAMDAVTQLARNVCEARDRYGLTQEQLSERSGVHPTEISRIEHGRRDIQISTLFKLAEALELTPGQLIDGTWGPTVSAA